MKINHLFLNRQREVMRCHHPLPLYVRHKRPEKSVEIVYAEKHHSQYLLLHIQCTARTVPSPKFIFKCILLIILNVSDWTWRCDTVHREWFRVSCWTRTQTQALMMRCRVKMYCGWSPTPTLDSLSCLGSLQATFHFPVSASMLPAANTD